MWGKSDDFQENFAFINSELGTDSAATTNIPTAVKQFGE
jgi:hypothetical protein